MGPLLSDWEADVKSYYGSHYSGYADSFATGYLYHELAGGDYTEFFLTLAFEIDSGSLEVDGTGDLVPEDISDEDYAVDAYYYSGYWYAFAL